MKKLILLPKCRCFKHTFDLEHEDLFQLMAHGWLAPPELSATVAGPCFCLLARHCRAALCDGSFTELPLTELFSWALRLPGTCVHSPGEVVSRCQGCTGRTS